MGEIIGWRWTFVALGLPGVALSAIVRFTLRDPTRGLVSDALTPSLGAESLRYALLVPGITTAVTVVALLAASRTLRSDLAAVGADGAEREPMPPSHSSTSAAGRLRAWHELPKAVAGTTTDRYAMPSGEDQ